LIETDQATAGVAPPRPVEELRVRLVPDTAALAPDDAARLSADVADVTYRACRGYDNVEFEAIRLGWITYYDQPGNRVQDYDRLALVYDGDTMVQFSGFMVVPMPPDATLLWYHAAVTDPAYQGTGVFAQARDVLVDPDWLTSFGSSTYLVFRTPNPLVYETARRQAHKLRDWYDGFYPKIVEGGVVEPMSEAVKDLGARIASALSPDREFDRDVFVVRDFLGRYGSDIYRQAPPQSDNAHVNRFFAEELAADNQDALMVIVTLVP
jgi:hypothetical protein